MKQRVCLLVDDDFLLLEVVEELVKRLVLNTWPEEGREVVFLTAHSCAEGLS